MIIFESFIRKKRNSFLHRRIELFVNFPAAFRNNKDADAIRVSLPGEIREECGAIACQAARK